ncbi:putative gamma-D-glutamyl-L-diamino acid endopeptidase-like protein [Luteimonas cucumeris]|uniref:Putative gamma-D-glutamyl-L-diamino acid endopeptidase-like protein n=1 Tax=Luteimonas cucumeris TaxID=985012 RepID=A0A562L7A1_9GAMM|nr:SH3 domain-containing protein [Luteimonas cucumeris]TWI03557.1 putative gamma-D-glutamyl-L-diamino acid endopeptidase-like protein [Luteimonas cucumeris]
MTIRHILFAGALSLLAACATAPVPASQPVPPLATDTRGVPGIDSAHLDPEFWIRRQQQADRVVLDRAAIAAQNARLLQTDDSVRDVAALPATLDGTQIKTWIGNLSKRPSRTLYDVQGRPVPANAIDALIRNLALSSVPASQATRYGLVTHRADLRTFPTRLRVFSRLGDTDIDRFQESALFPGTPVVIAHESRDGKWWFVVSPRYAAWLEKDRVAEGDRQAVFDYTRKTPYLVVTGATARTVYTPEQPQVSDLQLDMGIRVPLLRDWPADQPVNGQHHFASHVIELPIRGKDGKLDFTPALLPSTADVSGDYLPLDRAHLLRQSFKFLGERYGWGHSYNARDCSGFVSEVYRSFGITLPRNTSDQAVSPAFNRIAFSESDGAEKRQQAMRDLQVGDLVYIPGHVMMVIGHDKGMPYVIHDTSGGAWRGSDGRRVEGKLNSVSVTPLSTLLFNDEQTYVDRITNIQRIRP